MKLLPVFMVLGLAVPSFVEAMQPPPEPSTVVRGKDDGISEDKVEKENKLRTHHRRLLPLSVPGLVHLYTGDDSDAADLVGGATGTVGPSTKFFPGRNGLGFEFDGTAGSLVSLPVDINPSMFPQFTMGFWVKLRTLGGSCCYAWGLTNDNGFFDRTIALNDPRFGGVAAGVGSTYASTLPQITVNEWHCVAVAYDETSAEATVYYDGTRQTMIPTSLGIGATTASLGGNANFLNDYVDGRIDEVFMFDRFLNAGEIDTVCDELTNAKRGPAPTPAPKKNACFSGQSSIEVKGKGAMRMHQLKIGDEVLAADGTFSKVYSFGHYAPEAKSEYVQVQTAAMHKNNLLEISSEHLIYVKDEVTKSSHLVSGEDLKVGDCLLTEMGLCSEILSIRKVKSEGAYLPLTTTGNLLVNGVLASNYVTRDWLKTQFSGDSLHNFLHGATFPVRKMCSLLDCSDEVYDDTTALSLTILFLFRIEQWLLVLSPAVRYFFLAFLAVPAAFLVLLGKFLSLPAFLQVIHIVVAATSYFVLKHSKRIKNDTANESVVKS